MLTFLYIYLGIGVFFSWVTLELGHAQAKREGKSLYQVHHETMKDQPPEVQQFFTTPWSVLIAVLLFWWIVVVVMIVHAFTKK